MELSSILVLLKSCLQTCMTYTIAECTVNKLGQDQDGPRPGPVQKLSTNLYDIYHCWVYSE